MTERKNTQLGDALAKLIALQEESLSDPEVAHIKADEILMQCLRDLGCSHIADEFEKIRKWYT